MKARRFMAGALTCALVAVLGLAGCAGGSSNASDAGKATEPPAQKVQLSVFAANSLEKALPEVQKLYTERTGVTFADTQFKASGDLVSQLKASSTAADVLITASSATMDKASENGSIDAGTRRDMFLNDLVMAVASDSTLSVADLADLKTDAVSSFALGDPNTVPAGKYAVQSLKAAGVCSTEDQPDKTVKVTWDPSVEGKVNAGADKVGTVAQYVASGQVDAGFVYSSDIFRYKGIKSAYTVPSTMHKPIVYPGAVTADTAHAEAAAAFLQFCMEDPDAQAIFSAYGFELTS
ncbi:molybdate ABC transporter substrate-binding protein [Eggerthellaceae bacterium zg-1084]|uniref:Molybdate ABC transporter substrate-binding protein n=1 Tax=Berryella wangjianweii TaxID=2734634 RepID=A0A6M8JA89_9ACTN|nr:molybdate ABC transporter substrate-binding protein [Berryella wangjianweii]NPD31651.1 molybdate ABC transporter substrate-binding protein [Berryella wangjianweii]NPD32854.1 molybdate ABC transporter substrate-binding protein [Eggerthellaceae bacterium zg-997]QKF07732.1 molybdate ABC transporter substrate-binding protein [Berryella wangjianweii]